MANPPPPRPPFPPGMPMAPSGFPMMPMPPPPPFMQQQQQQQPIELDEVKLNEKSKRWQQLNTKRYSDKKRSGFVETQKENMPPEHLR